MRLAIAAVLALSAVATSAADPGADVAKLTTVAVRAEPASLKVGGRGVLSLTIEPPGEAHVDPKAPLKATLAGPAGLALAKTTLGRAEAVPSGPRGVRLEAPFTASAAGPQEVKARIEFFICTDQWCLKQTREAAVTVDVK
jgi:hypothetical protein